MVFAQKGNIGDLNNYGQNGPNRKKMGFNYKILAT